MCVRCRFERQKFIDQINDNFIATTLMVFHCGFQRLIHRSTAIPRSDYKKRFDWYMEWWQHNPDRVEVIRFVRDSLQVSLRKLHDTNGECEEDDFGDNEAENRDPLPSDYQPFELQVRSGDVIGALSSMGPTPSSPILPPRQPFRSSPPPSYRPDALDTDDELDSQHSDQEALFTRAQLDKSPSQEEGGYWDEDGEWDNDPAERRPLDDQALESQPLDNELMDLDLDSQMLPESQRVDLVGALMGTAVDSASSQRTGEVEPESPPLEVADTYDLLRR